jgi:hypothetical protein
MTKLLSLLILTCPLLAHAADLAEQRNEAVATVSASVVTLQKMENLCVKQQAISASVAKSALDAWRQRNDVFLYTQSGYLNAYFKAYAKENGEAAAKAMQQDLTADSNTAADGNVKVLLGSQKPKAACTTFFTALNGGKYDINSNYPYYPVLKEMVELLGLSDRLTQR